MENDRIRLREFGDQIDQVCRDHNIFKRDIAEKMEVSNSYLSQIIARGGTPSQIEKVVEALNKLDVRIKGEEIKPSHFEIYNALVAVEEARAGDQGAAAALRWYSQYRQAGDRKRREMLGKLAA